jgi:hypothetical protein
MDDIEEARITAVWCKRDAYERKHATNLESSSFTREARRVASADWRLLGNFFQGVVMFGADPEGEYELLAAIAYERSDMVGKP